MNGIQIRGTIVEWEQCNAMQDEWGEGEVHCKDCTLMLLDKWQKDTGEVFELDEYVNECFRGGFAPVIIHGAICEHCRNQIK